MKRILVEGLQERQPAGSRAARHARREGLVPAAFYGRGGPKYFFVKYTQAEKLVFTPHVYLVELFLGGQPHTAILREYQLHPVHDYILHLDFLGCSPEDKITIELPIRLEGTAEGVQMGGKLVPLMRKLKVRGRVQDLPDYIPINVTSLKLGKTLTVGRAEVEGLELLSPPDAAIARIEIPRALRAQQD